MEHQDDRIGRIVAYAHAGNPDAVGEALSLLRDPLGARFYHDVNSGYTHLEDVPAPNPVVERVRGIFEFFQFAHTAEEDTTLDRLNCPTEWQRLYGNGTTSEDAERDADTWIRADKTTVREFLKHHYAGLGGPLDLDRSTLRLYARGTTSLILHVSDPPSANGQTSAPAEPGDRTSRERIVKLVKPQYIDNASISESTQRYQSKMDRIVGVDSEHVPTVYQVGPSWVVMSWIQGETLRAYCQAHLWPYLGQPVFFRRAETILSRLFALLATYARAGCLHEDLSPQNIIVWHHPDDVDDIDVRLVDFGVNYMLDQRVGGLKTFEEARAFMAPEQLERMGKERVVNGTPEADLYSVGAVMTELLLGNRLERTTVVDALDTVHARRFANLGLVLDELILSQSTSRARSFRSDAGVYHALARRVSTELKVAAALHEEERPTRWSSRLARLADYVFPGLTELRRHWYEQQLRLKAQDTDGRSEARLFFRGLTIFLHALIVASFAVKGLGLVWAAWRGTPEPDSWERLGAYLVGLSFSLIAARYYGDIFGEIDVADLSWGAQRSIQLMSFFFAIPILATFWCSPWIWAIGSSLGALVSTLSNYTTWQISAEARDVLRKVKSGVPRAEAPRAGVPRARVPRAEVPRAEVPRDLEEFWTKFGEWAKMTVSYGLILLFLAALLAAGRAQDWGIYAAVVTMVNLGFLYNTARDAAIIRSGIARNAAVLRQFRASVSS